MNDAPAFVLKADWFCARGIASRCDDIAHADHIGVAFASFVHSDGGLFDGFDDHCAAEIGFGADIVGVEFVVRLDGGFGPVRGRSSCGVVAERRERAISKERCADDADEVLAA